MIWRMEKPISNRGRAMAGGGGDVDSLLLGSDRAAAKIGIHLQNHTDILYAGLSTDLTACKTGRKGTLWSYIFLLL